MKTFEQLAASAYAAYCKQAGGHASDGRPFFDWESLPSEWKACWIASTKQVASEVSQLL